MKRKDRAFGARQQRNASRGRLGEVFGILMLGISAFLFLALISYSPMDVSINTAHPNDPPANYIGLVGAWFSFFSFLIFGLASFLLSLFTGLAGIRVLFHGRLEHAYRWFFLVLANLISLSCILELQWEWSLSHWTRHFGLESFGPGGILGEWLVRRASVMLIGREGSYILFYSIFAASLIFVADVPLTRTARRLGKAFADACFLFLRMVRSLWPVILVGLKSFRTRRTTRKELSPVIIEAPKSVGAALGYEDVLDKVRKREPKSPSLEEKKAEAAPQKPAKETRIQLELISHGNYQLPGISLLEDLGSAGARSSGTEDLKRNAEILKTTLGEFGVDVDVVNITRGPVITRYELQPAPGVKVQRIVGLSNDIALTMKCGSVRIIAPIPGKAAVGIEVPNATSTMVSLKELLVSEEFKNARKRIPLVFGKDVSGIPIIADLSEMPHLLIAGATGSGKSVCINSIVLNILYYASPEYIRFLMIDPKMVELSLFNEIPHLVIPVITDARKAAAGLAWLVTEMERRYKILAEAGVRNIEGLNEKISKEKVVLRSSDEPLKPLPYIVVIIDELADIMMVSSYEVENSIARLAQLSRAIGIHLILATQRPSVDVITGVIKANFPARISFQVSSRVDSRTVLDSIGAEKLLGKGDLLYMPPGSSKLIRAQGALVRESEIRRVLDFIKSQKVGASVDASAQAEILEKTQALAGDLNQMDDEALLQEAIKVIRATNQASVSILQRKLRIGYSRAARIMDLLEERGVVGPYKGSKARDILIDMEIRE